MSKEKSTKIALDEIEESFAGAINALEGGGHLSEEELQELIEANGQLRAVIARI